MLLFTLHNNTFDGKGEINVALFFDCTLVCPKYIYIYKKNSTRYKLAKTKWSVGAEPPQVVDNRRTQTCPEFLHFPLCEFGQYS